MENDIKSRKRYADDDVFRRIPEDAFMALTTDEKNVVNFLTKQTEINVTLASLATGRSWPTAAKVLASLVEKGHIEPVTKRGRKHDSTKTYRFKTDVFS